MIDQGSMKGGFLTLRFPFLVLLGGVGILACGQGTAKPGDAAVESGSDASDVDGGADGDADADSDSGFDAGFQSGCGNGSVGPYDETVTIDYYGVERTYRLIVPGSYDDDVPAPLLASFHDLGETVDDHVRLSGLKELSEGQGVVVLAMQGVLSPDAGLPSWNTGQEDSPKSDDIMMLHDLLFEISAAWCIDAKRLYVGGFGRGGFFASRAMYLMDDLLAAVEVESGGLKPCCDPPKLKRSSIIFHGEEDHVVPIDAGLALRDYWVGHDYLDPTRVETDSNGCEVYHDFLPDSGVDPSLDIEVRYCGIPAMGHARAGVPDSPEDGTIAPYRATDVAWEFLKRFSR